VSLVARLPQIYDEPFGDISAIPTFTVCAEARKTVTVALSGDGGDEALAGYRRYAFQSIGDGVRRVLPAALRQGVFGPLASLYPHASWLPQMLRAKSTLRELSLDSASAYARMSSALPQDVRLELISGDFQRALGGYDSRDVVRVPFEVDAPLDSLQRAQYADLMTYLPGDILTKVDRASMANSLEVRSPMLDPEFVGLSFYLPSSEKLGRAGGKAILKRAMAPYLPEDLLYRKKQGFTVPLAQWLRGPLKPNVLELAQSSRLRDSGVVDMSTVSRMTREHLSGSRDHSKGIWLTWVFDAFLAQRAQMS
jgi:asparagine synthase (glutamine-hydrolysing)